MFCWVEIVFIFVFNYKSWYLSMGESRCGSSLRIGGPKFVSGFVLRVGFSAGVVTGNRLR